MIPAGTSGEVLEAIQKVKAGAPAFCTNFFPLQRKLQEWTWHGELQVEAREGAAFFLRQDRDFWRFYFCAADVAALRREITALAELKSRPLVTDLVGSEEALHEVIATLASAGFRPYSRLQRMARAGGLPAENPSGAESQEVVWAENGDGMAVLELLESSFDRHADQLPFAREIDAAIDGRQILTVKSGGTLAALLHFETQGFTSVVRYWAVDGRFRAQRFGSALMRRYLESHGAVRRFTLWVVSENKNAIEKYRHYGYEPDGLVDHVLANESIAA
jgi:ribosomal protein S18 acetylase RimI-like enzyme